MKDNKENEKSLDLISRNNQILIPCGCGGKVHTTQYSYKNNKPQYGVTCTVCLANIPAIHDNVDDAIKAWNTAMGGGYRFLKSQELLRALGEE